MEVNCSQRMDSGERFLSPDNNASAWSIFQNWYPTPRITKNQMIALIQGNAFLSHCFMILVLLVHEDYV